MGQGQLAETDEWFVIQTNPQSEKKADGELRRAGLRVYLPKRSTEVRDRRNHGEPKVKWRPLLVGYLFVRFPDHLLDRRGQPPFGLVRECQGVRSFVRAANAAGEWEPLAIPGRLVAQFMRRQRSREFGRPAIVDPKAKLAALRLVFKPGIEVAVIAGPFTTFRGSMVKLNDDMTVEIELNIFGRGTRVRLDVTDVETPRVESESIRLDAQSEAA